MFPDNIPVRCVIETSYVYVLHDFLQNSNSLFFLLFMGEFIDLLLSNQLEYWSTIVLTTPGKETILTPIYMEKREAPKPDQRE